MELKNLDLPFLKRFAFADENEFRFVYESRTKCSKLDIPIPMSCVLKVTLSPWLHPDVADIVKIVLRSIDGCKQLRISRSTLIGNTEWKEFGEQAY